MKTMAYTGRAHHTSLTEKPSINRQRDASDPSNVVTGEEDGSPGHIFWDSHSAERVSCVRST